MRVREFRDGDQGPWDEFVRSCEYSTPQHLIAWKGVFSEVFQSDVHYFLASEDDSIMGILPLIHIKSLITGQYVTSIPGGLCAVSQEAAKLLLECAVELVREKKAKYLILRDGRKKWDFPDFMTDEEHVTVMIEIPSSLNHIKSAMERRTRQLINKAIKSNLNAVFGLNNLDEYYPIYSRAVQDLGTPTLGLRFFKSMADHFPDEANLLTIRHQNTIVGGGFMSLFKQSIYCTWSGLPREYYRLRTSHLLMWETLKHAFENGYQFVDLGRCKKDSGGFTFKKAFGGEPVQLYQQIYMNSNGQPPKVGSGMEENLKFRFFVNVWRRLPSRITEVLGPELRKRVPFG